MDYAGHAGQRWKIQFIQKNSCVWKPYTQYLQNCLQIWKVFHLFEGNRLEWGGKKGKLIIWKWESGNSVAEPQVLTPQAQRGPTNQWVRVWSRGRFFAGPVKENGWLMVKAPKLSGGFWGSFYGQNLGWGDCFLAAPPLFLHLLPSLISSCFESASWNSGKVKEDEWSTFPIHKKWGWGGAWKGFILGRAPQDPAPFQSDEITGFDFGRRAGWVER